MEEATQTVRADPCNRAFRAYSFPTEKGKNKTTKQTDNINNTEKDEIPSRFSKSKTMNLNFTHTMRSINYWFPLAKRYRLC